MPKISLLFFLFSLFISASAQEIIKDTSIVINDSNAFFSLTMNGFLDGQNTLTRNPYTKVFEPMIYIKIKNNGNKKIIHPRIVFNSRGRWFTINQMRNECFANAVTEKEKALSLWKFLRDNRVHALGPQLTDNMNDPMKLLGVYGYGMCYNTNYAMCFLAKPYTISPYKGYSPQGLHYVSEMNFGTGYVHLDSDIETFYLKNDNNTLAGSQDIFTDRYLITRTHHYGRQFNFSANTNNYVSNLYYKYDPSYYFGYISESNFHKLDFNLRPGESIIYDWTLPLKEHTDNMVSDNNDKNQINGPISVMNKPELFTDYVLKEEGKKDFFVQNTKETVIGNGMFDFRMNFVNVALSEIMDYFSNVAIRDSAESGPNLHLQNIGSKGEMIVKITSPFVIVDGYAKGNFVRSSVSDSIQIFWSKDSLVWIKATDISGAGNFADSIGLSSLINSEESALYKYYLKFILFSLDSAKSCGIDSLEIRTQFQTNKFFLPYLTLGYNMIEYTDASNDQRNISLEIKWKESSDNAPPDQISTPLFPQDNSEINNLKFTFQWPAPNDQDGNDIVNYEFQLSDRVDMKFPLSPTFDTYICEQDSSMVSPSFNVPQSGLLNDSTVYYWRVRAKDSYGAWGQWSPVWSFIPHGVMPPQNTSAFLINDSIHVSWQNAGGQLPTYYEVHGSNEWMGFTPDSITFIDTTSQTSISFILNGSNKLFYRIIAVNSNGEKSGVSEIAEISYPKSLAANAGLIYPDTLYTLNIKPAKFYYTRVNPLNYSLVSHEDSITNIVLSKPPFLSLINDTLIGFSDSTFAFELLFNPSLGKVNVKYTSDITGVSDSSVFQIKSGYVNSSPHIGNIQLEAVVDIPFHDTIFIADNDIFYGDSLMINVISKPSWLSANNYQNTIIISGTPAFSDTGQAVIAISAEDKLGSICIKNILINVLPFKILFTYSGETCSPAVAFADSSIISSNDSIILWNWDFGDGNLSSQKNPVHAYPFAGIYIVSLNAVSSFGCTRTFIDTLNVIPSSAASFVYSGGGCLSNVFFTDFSSTPYGDAIALWSWDFGDGGFDIIQHPVHTYTVPGTYTVKLAIISAAGCVDIITDTLHVFPTPYADFNTVTCQQNTICFADSSVISTGNIISWYWEFGDGKTDTMQNPIHTYDSTGIYIAFLKIISDLGCSSSVTDTVVLPWSPVSTGPISETNNIVVYPNPVSDILFINVNDEFGSSDIYIYNSLGQIVCSDKLLNYYLQKKSIDISFLPRGIYQLCIRTADKQWKASIQKN